MGWKLHWQKRLVAISPISIGSRLPYEKCLNAFRFLHDPYYQISLMSAPGTEVTINEVSSNRAEITVTAMRHSRFSKEPTATVIGELIDDESGWVAYKGQIGFHLDFVVTRIVGLAILLVGQILLAQTPLVGTIFLVFAILSVSTYMISRADYDRLLREVSTVLVKE